ncbi:hypothetical protein BABINDRAFT_161233 [Babjeviella inositovora NRRL Y-12698]|uniref:Uncharacterized protein n=1 Tax=Babjeviella inositovora NRRL Y-12698 TaxID=984486 RepID=A0A1E3QRK3_9ASCO|nr:uncharacterized protein BABINDRAFT_161233 [Babjeviella inositovora NRRL Y-12698]ODQ80268.1 hypothetical protein BABINDRAFT_161233 [Babjeviella inositovora NRRL Y-12698]
MHPSTHLSPVPVSARRGHQHRRSAAISGDFDVNSIFLPPVACDLPKATPAFPRQSPRYSAVSRTTSIAASGVPAFKFGDDSSPKSNYHFNFNNDEDFSNKITESFNFPHSSPSLSPYNLSDETFAYQQNMSTSPPAIFVNDDPVPTPQGRKIFRGRDRMPPSNLSSPIAMVSARKPARRLGTNGSTKFFMTADIGVNEENVPDALIDLDDILSLSTPKRTAHRRTESAPELENFNRKASPVHPNNGICYPSVFDTPLNEDFILEDVEEESEEELEAAGKAPSALYSNFSGNSSVSSIGSTLVNPSASNLAPPVNINRLTQQSRLKNRKSMLRFEDTWKTKAKASGIYVGSAPITITRAPEAKQLGHSSSLPAMNASKSSLGKLIEPLLSSPAGESFTSVSTSNSFSTHPTPVLLSTPATVIDDDGRGTDSSDATKPTDDEDEYTIEGDSTMVDSEITPKFVPVAAFPEALEFGKASKQQLHPFQGGESFDEHVAVGQVSIDSSTSTLQIPAVYSPAKPPIYYHSSKHNPHRKSLVLPAAVDLSGTGDSDTESQLSLESPTRSSKHRRSALRVSLVSSVGAGSLYNSSGVGSSARQRPVSACFSLSEDIAGVIDFDAEQQKHLHMRKEKMKNHGRSKSAALFLAPEKEVLSPKKSPKESNFMNHIKFYKSASAAETVLANPSPSFRLGPFQKRKERSKSVLLPTTKTNRLSPELVVMSSDSSSSFGSNAVVISGNGSFLTPTSSKRDENSDARERNSKLGSAPAPEITHKASSSPLSTRSLAVPLEITRSQSPQKKKKFFPDISSTKNHLRRGSVNRLLPNEVMLNLRHNRLFGSLLMVNLRSSVRLDLDNYDDTSSVVASINTERESVMDDAKLRNSRKTPRIISWIRRR